MKRIILLENPTTEEVAMVLGLKGSDGVVDTEAFKREFGTPVEEVMSPVYIDENVDQDEGEPVDVDERYETTVDSDLELDARGESWNPEIHASNKSKTAKGMWKAKPQRGAAPPPADETGETVAAPALTYADFIALATGKLQSGEITRDAITAALVDAGLTSLVELNAKPELISAVAGALWHA